MYISHRGLLAIHEERVQASLERSKRRRMLKAAKQQHEAEIAARTPEQKGVLRGLVAVLANLV